MELRLLVRKGLEPPDARGNVSAWENEPVLQYRVLETVIGSAMCRTDTHLKWSKWKDVPTVIEHDNP